MPSPFPGMDPYLEHPHWFHGFHNSSDHLHPGTAPASAAGCLLRADRPARLARAGAAPGRAGYQRDAGAPNAAPRCRSGRDRRGRTRGADRPRPAGRCSSPSRTVDPEEHTEIFLEIRERPEGPGSAGGHDRGRQPGQQDPEPPRLRQVPEEAARRSSAGQVSPHRDRPAAQGDARHGRPARPRPSQGRAVRLSRLGPPLRPAQGLSRLSDPAGAAAAGDRDPPAARRSGGARWTCRRRSPGLRRRAVSQGASATARTRSNRALRPEQAEWVKSILKAAGEGEPSAPEPADPHQPDETTGKKEVHDGL